MRPSSSSTNSSPSDDEPDELSSPVGSLRLSPDDDEGPSEDAPAAPPPSEEGSPDRFRFGLFSPPGAIGAAESGGRGGAADGDARYR